MASMVDDEYDRSHEKMLLQEVESFLKEKRLSPQDYMIEKQ